MNVIGIPLYERLTGRAKQALWFAVEEAKTLNHPSIGPEHILMGLIRNGEGATVDALNELGVNLLRVHDAAMLVVNTGEEPRRSEPDLSVSARQTIEYADKEARRLNHPHIGTEHLLLGIVRQGEDGSTEVLDIIGLHPEEVREQILRLMLRGTTETGSPGERPTVLMTPDEGIRINLDHLPTVQIPEDYNRTMSSFLACMAVERGPIFKVEWAPHFQVVYMIGPEANEFVLHMHREHFSSDFGWSPNIGEVLGKGLLNMDDPEHTRHRNVIEPALMAPYMARYLVIMQRVIKGCISNWGERGEVDLCEETHKIAFDVAAEALLGLRLGEQVDHLRKLFRTMLNSKYDSRQESEKQFRQRVMVVRDELDQILLSIIAERREAPTDDMLGLLVQARDGKGQALSGAQLLGHAKVLLVGGHETTAWLGAWLLYLLITHPAYLARVQSELGSLSGVPDGLMTLEGIKAMKVLGNAFKEAGRLYPSIGNVPRGVVKDFEFGGYRVPAGARIVYSIAASHRLPGIFQNPDMFDPDRFLPPRREDKRHPYALVTFGGGLHICLGMNFAQAEIKAIAAHILSSYSLGLVPGQDIVQVYPRAIGYPLHGIRVRVKAHS
jgi:retinoid hydroxylase